MKSKNTKVNRMLMALAIVLKDEDDKLLKAINDVINDDRDGYNYDFYAQAKSAKITVLGRSY